MTDDQSYILIVRCPDRKGIVAAVAGYLADNGASITESNHFNDALADYFYMRTVFRPDGPMPPLDVLRQGFQPIAYRYGMDWELHDVTTVPRVLILVSGFGHCLYDLLHRQRSGAIRMDIPAVISNHEDMRSFTEWSGIPYHHLPVKAANRAEQEAEIVRIVEEQRIDLVVLARYMQVLSPELSSRLAGRCINIHHSFLPSFKGAKPYHQAFERGVKIIGATAHYVTNDLDEGPIIEQDIQRVDHTHTPDQLVEIGRDIECSVLARAVRWHLERRVIQAGRKTVVFR
ncbi:formyltetrahydrofolate deformylase [Indioceanicola profundi]|uniref:formyltetrahydrofolate deformylase n=1 Tax=Indioceanicola profundi TaxID=2220096 RepID=UPI000E6AD91C|nr:formyltetrahydrofolate deformylase [Indioceanicola profundi]